MSATFGKGGTSPLLLLPFKLLFNQKPGFLVRIFTTNMETQLVEELGKLKYFLRIEVAYSKQGIFLSQLKYIIDLLFETGRFSSKPMGTQLMKIIDYVQPKRVFQ